MLRPFILKVRFRGNGLTGVKFAFKLVGVSVITAILAWLGLVATPGAGQAPAIWWANAALASIILLDRRGRWPLLLLAGLVGIVAGHLFFPFPLWESVALSVCSTGEAAVAVYGVAIGVRQRVDLTHQRQFFLFIVFGVLLGPLLNSMFAGLLLHFVAGGLPVDPLHWVSVDALGMVVVVPLVLGVARHETRELFHPANLINTLLYLLMIASATTVAFSRVEFPWPFLVLPLLLLLAIRLGPSGASLGCCVVAVFATLFAFSPHGQPIAQLADPRVEHRIAMVQLFLAVAVLSVGVVSMLYADFTRASHAAEASENRYRALALSMNSLAAEDTLTGIANRRLFDRTILSEWQRAMRNGSPISLLLLEVDRFKAFNELYGQLEGDNCLRVIAAEAFESSRRSSDTAARFGGDEFAIILPETAAAGALEIAERVRAGVLRRAIPHAGNSPAVVTVSVGCVTAIPAKGASVTPFITAADSALYGAKQAGHNRVEVATV